MKISDCFNTFYEFSGKTSEIVRQLSFAGIAVIWIFKTGNQGNEKICDGLILPAILLVCTLAADLIHNLVGALVWYRYGRRQEKRGISRNKEFEAPDRTNFWIWFFWYTKIFLLTVSYFMLLVYLFTKLII